MITLLLLSCTFEEPATPGDSDSDASVATVNLKVWGNLPDGVRADCQALVDGAVQGACGDSLTWPATTAVIAVGAGDESSEDGLPLHRESDDSLWVAPYHEVDLATPAPYYSDWIIAQEEDAWEASITLNRYVGGLWDCTAGAVSDDGGEGSGARVAADTVLGTPITVTEGRWLQLDPALWSRAASVSIEVSGNKLEPDSPDGDLDASWTVAEDTLSIGIWGDDGGSSWRADCVRAAE